jgi:hypothetical protein
MPYHGNRQADGPHRLYHSFFPPHDVLLMERLARWLTSRSGRFAGTMDFVHAMLLMAEEAGTMGFVRVGLSPASRGWRC